MSSACFPDLDQEVEDLLVLGQSLFGGQPERILDQGHIDAGRVCH
jgi:hypothetical protein